MCLKLVCFCGFSIYANLVIVNCSVIDEVSIMHAWLNFNVQIDCASESSTLAGLMIAPGSVYRQTIIIYF